MHRFHQLTPAQLVDLARNVLKPTKKTTSVKNQRGVDKTTSYEEWASFREVTISVARISNQSHLPHRCRTSLFHGELPNFAELVAIFSHQIPNWAYWVSTPASPLYIVCSRGWLVDLYTLICSRFDIGFRVFDVYGWFILELVRSTSL